MIEATRLDGSIFYLNPHQIEVIECRPDTAISLVSGKRMVVKDSYQTILERIIHYRQTIHQMPTAKAESAPLSRLS